MATEDLDPEYEQFMESFKQLTKEEKLAKLLELTGKLTQAVDGMVLATYDNLDALATRNPAACNETTQLLQRLQAK